MKNVNGKKAFKNGTIIRSIFFNQMVILLFQFYKKSFQEIKQENNQKKVNPQTLHNVTQYCFSIYYTKKHSPPPSVPPRPHHYSYNLLFFHCFYSTKERKTRRKISLFNIYQHKHGNTTHLISCCDTFSEAFVFPILFPHSNKNISIVITI